jgi:S-DNA-T family DNA segregation ATPase FtsK/SpoIIIE
VGTPILAALDTGAKAIHDKNIHVLATPPTLYNQDYKPASDNIAVTVSGLDVCRGIAKRFISAARQRSIMMDHEPVWVKIGPTLHSFGVRLPVGQRVDRLQGAIQDIARDIGLGDLHSFIVVENDDRPQTVKVLIPRSDRSFPPLPDTSTLRAVSEEDYIPLCIGQTIDGADFYSSLRSWPHLLVAGSTGSGKTKFLRSMIKQIARFGPQHAQMIIIDGKGELDYMDLVSSSLHPQYPEIVSGIEHASEVLTWCLTERARRVEAAHAAAIGNARSGFGITQFDLYKQDVENGNRNPLILPLIVIIDEFADIMIQQQNSRVFEESVQRIVQIGRSSLIHLLLATQRPDAKVLSGRIRANLSGRAIFNLPTVHDSMTALAVGGAEKLSGKGDMLFKSGSGSLTRMQSYNV